LQSIGTHAQQLSRSAGRVGSLSGPSEGASRRGALTGCAARGDLSRSAGEMYLGTGKMRGVTAE